MDARKAKEKLARKKKENNIKMHFAGSILK